MKKAIFIASLIMTLSLSACASSSGITAETSPNGIDEKIYVNINGAEQYLLIRGENKDNPIILNLHGGPGVPDSSVLYDLISNLQDDFTYVCWDQRGFGRTYYKNKKTNPEVNIVTKERALEDVDCVVDYLRTRFNKDKIIILGHSYGSLLGLNYVIKHPEKVEHYIGISQIVNFRQAFENIYLEARELLKDSPKKQAKFDEEYNEIIESNGGKSLFKFQRKALKMLEKNMPGIEKNNQVKLVMHSPDFSFTDLKWYAGILNINRYKTGNKELFEWLGDEDFMKKNKDFSMPVSFISGEYDRICPAKLTEKYMKAITAPSKNHFILQYKSHSPQLTDPAKVAEVIKKAIYESKLSS